MPESLAHIAVWEVPDGTKTLYAVRVFWTARGLPHGRVCQVWPEEMVAEEMPCEFGGFRIEDLSAA